jgi:hypothetical protein
MSDVAWKSFSKPWLKLASKSLENGKELLDAVQPSHLRICMKKALLVVSVTLVSSSILFCPIGLISETPIYYTCAMGCCTSVPMPFEFPTPNSAVISSSVKFPPNADQSMLLRRIHAVSSKGILRDMCKKGENAFGERARAQTRNVIARARKQTRMLSSRGVGSSDEQEVPAPLSHRVPPVDTLNASLCELAVVDPPDFAQELFDSSVRAKLRSVAELVRAL